MKNKPAYPFILAILLNGSPLTAFADHAQFTAEDITVAGTCMIEKFKNRKPAIAESKIEACAKVAEKDVPECLGLTNQEYNDTLHFCGTEWQNARCMAEKMKVKITDYASCGYKKDPAACFKALGFTPEAVAAFNETCRKLTAE